MADEKIAEEMRLTYQRGLDEIDYLKRQQWTVAYYIILLYAGLLGIKSLVPNEANGLDHTIGILAILIGLSLVWLILDLQHSLRNSRRLVCEIQDKHFNPETQAVLETPGVSTEQYTSFWYQSKIWGLIVSTTVIGASWPWRFTRRLALR